MKFCSMCQGFPVIPKALVASLECHGGLCICMLPAFVPNEALERLVVDESVAFVFFLSFLELQTNRFKWMEMVISKHFSCKDLESSN